MHAKGLLITGSIGLVGVGGISYAGYEAISSKSEIQEKNNIENKLKNEGYKLIKKGSTHFDAILVDYKTVTAKINNKALKFDDFAGDNKDGKKAKDILWEQCEGAFNSDVSEEILNKARKWCVEPIDVRQLLTNQGLAILSTATADDNTTKTKWETKIQNYRGSAQEKKVFEGLNVGEGQVAKTPEHVKAIKEKCDAAGKILNHKEEYEKNLKNFTDWCLDKQ